jgi:hypothetical protein
MEAFEKELEKLINKYSIENEVDMPDFILARMICRMIEAMGPSIKKTLDWHGCEGLSVSHQAETHEEALRWMSECNYGRPQTLAKLVRIATQEED